ncbi:MAG: reverse transcriptase domain-containing protein [Sweet potato little leaf phytoplasma]|nr:reverse transcriptase domain-containing protein [Sweet potato little leaf phytoplasma]
MKHFENRLPMYLLLYVDDMLLASSDKHEIRKLKNQLKCEFDMKELGAAKRILGIDIKRNRRQGILCLSQEAYSIKMLSKFNMYDSKSVPVPLGRHFKLSVAQSPSDDRQKADMANIPYASAVGSLMYLMVCTRPDLAHAMSVVSRFMANPGKEHWQAVKWIMRYVKGTVSYGLEYNQQGLDSTILKGYVDADYAADCDRRRSLSGYVFAYFGNLVSWRTSLQSVVALSTTVSEYIATTDAIKEGIWLKELTSELSSCVKEVKIHCDSQSAVCLSKNQTYHDRTKHIDVRYHFIRDILNEGEFKLVKISTEDNPADAFTKALPLSKFESCLSTLKISPV